MKILKNNHLKGKYFVSVLSVIISVLFVLSGCNKDDDNNTPPKEDENKIIGSWVLDTYDPAATIDGKTPEQFLEDELGITGIFAQTIIEAYMAEMNIEDQVPATIQFKSDSTYAVTFNNDSADDGKWIMADTILTTDPGTEWEKVFFVDELTDTKLDVHYVETRYQDLTEDGTDEIIIATIYLYYLK